MATVNSFEDLEVWKLARELSGIIYKITLFENFFTDYRFRDQIRAAAGSVMDNIAEGFERSSRLEFINFLSIAKGSCGEVKSQLYRAFDQGYITEDKRLEIYNSYNKLSAGISKLITYLNKTSVKGLKFKDRV